jgi:Flp pilus assembly pilin Flp
MSGDDRGGQTTPAGALRTLRDDEAAPTAVEYALMLGGVALAVIVVVAALGNRVDQLFQSLASSWP